MSATRIVAPIGPRALIRHAECLTAGYERDSMDRIGASNHEAEDRVSPFVIRDAVTILATEQRRPLGAKDDHNALLQQGL